MAATANITPASRVSRKAGLLSAAVDDELVLMNAERNEYFGLDETGRAIWEILAEPATVADLCRRLAAAYEGDPQAMERDVTAFLKELAAQGLVLIDE